MNSIFIDSIHDGIARLIDEYGNQCFFPAVWLPADAAEGEWLIMSFTIDMDKKAKEHEAVQSLLDELAAGDTGMF